MHKRDVMGSVVFKYMTKEKKSKSSHLQSYSLTIFQVHGHNKRYKQVYFKYEELISKTTYIHSYMLLICSSGHSKKANFQHKIYFKWKMLILIVI